MKTSKKTQLTVTPPPFAKLIGNRRTITRLAGLLAVVLAVFTAACKQPTSAGSRGGGETPEEDSITKGVSSLASLSIVCEGFPEDVAKNVYPDIKTFSGTQKYYLVPYPLGSSGKIKVTFTPKVGSALSTVLLNGFTINADAPSAQRNNEADDGEEPVEEKPEEEDTPTAHTYTIDVLATDTAHKVEIALSNLDYGENITYTLNINGVNSTGGGMKEVAVPTGNSFEIPADILNGAYFAHIQFAGGPNRLKKLVLSTLSVGTDVNAGLEGMTGTPSKWKLNADGSITVTQGSIRINAVYVGPKYYYDYLYAADEIDAKLLILEDLIDELTDGLLQLGLDLNGLNVGQAEFAENLLEAVVPAPASGGGGFLFTLTGQNPAFAYGFAYFKLSGADAWHTVSLTESMPVTVATGVTLNISGGDVTITVPNAGGNPAVEPQRFFFGTTAASYNTLLSLGEQLTSLSELIAADYATLAALEAAVDAKAAEAVGLLVDGLTTMIGTTGALRAAADTLAGGGGFSSLTSASDKITAVQAALAQVVNNHDESIAAIHGALGTLNGGEYSGPLNAYVNSFTSQSPAHQRAHSVSFAYATTASTDKPAGEPTGAEGHFISRLGRYVNSGSYDAHQTFIPVNSLKRYERQTTTGQTGWGAWTRTDAAYAVDYANGLNVRNVGSFNGSLNTFTTVQQQPLNSTYFGYSTGTGDGLGKPTGDTGEGFFTSETGDTISIIHQTFRPAGTSRVWERYSADGGFSWAPAWTRTDAEVAALNVRNVGSIAPTAVNGNLNGFITAYSQPGGSTYYAYFTSGGTNNWPVNAAGFFTCYLGTYTDDGTYFARQEYRPVNSTQIYQRFKTGTAEWGGWAPFFPEMANNLLSQLHNDRIIINKTVGTVLTNYIGRAVRLTGSILLDNRVSDASQTGMVSLTNGMIGVWSKYPNGLSGESILIFDITGTLSDNNSGPNNGSGWLYFSQNLGLAQQETTFIGSATLSAW